MDKPEEQRIRNLIFAKAGRNNAGVRCRGCNDIGWVLMPSRQVGNYPPGTPLSQRTFVKGDLEKCRCNAE